MTQDFYKKMLIEENISVIIPSDEDIKIINDIILMSFARVKSSKILKKNI